MDVKFLFFQAYLFRVLDIFKTYHEIYVLGMQIDLGEYPREELELNERIRKFVSFLDSFFSRKDNSE